MNSQENEDQKIVTGEPLIKDVINSYSSASNIKNLKEESKSTISLNGGVSGESSQVTNPLMNYVKHKRESS